MRGCRMQALDDASTCFLLGGDAYNPGPELLGARPHVFVFTLSGLATFPFEPV